MTKLVGSFLLVALIISSAAGISDYYRNIPGNHNKKEASSHTNMHFASDKKITSSVLTRSNFEDSIKTLYNTIGLKAYDMNYAVFRYGMIGYHALKQEGKLNSKSLVSFIDFTKKSTEKRFYTIDLKTHKVKYHSLVSHGRNTGEDEAKKFSNILHSNQCSLGFYVTGETYVGSKGYSLRLDGVEGKFNSNMRKRAVVMHEAAYVSEDWINVMADWEEVRGALHFQKVYQKK